MTSRPRRIRRLLASPLTLAVLTLLVFGGLIWAVQTRPPWGHHGGVVQRLAHEMLPKQRVTVSSVRPTVVTVRRGNEWIAVGLWEDDWKVASATDDSVQVSLLNTEASYGLLVASVRSHTRKLFAYQFEGSLTPERQAEAEELALRKLAEVVDPHVVAALGTDRQWRRRWIDVPLLLADVAWLVALIAWPRSLFLVIQRVRTGRRRRRLAQMQCPSCRYDIRGLDGDTCPECGTTGISGARPVS